MTTIAQLGVVVIGGSAGAIDALLSLLGGLPDALAAPIAIAIHQPQSRPSLLRPILARSCRREVIEIEDKQPLVERCIFVAPPNYHVLIERARSFALSVDAPVHFSRPSIDVLFGSAADAFGAATGGVLLSGTNEDGADGLRQIADAGGWAAVQSPHSAEYAAMPAAGIDRVGPRVRIIDELSQLFREDSCHET